MLHHVSDLAALERAARRCGLELVRGQAQFKWFWGDTDYPRLQLPAHFAQEYVAGQCDHAIRVPGNNEAFEIGVVPLADRSGYGLIWDSWRGGYGLEERAGPLCSRLLAEYVALTK
jgi:hypothetical protein